MGIFLYSTLSRKKEEFVPLKKSHVRMYVCGPTVYDESHIGHARGAFVFDVIRNYFKYKGYKVTLVRNVTDVDDKIIDKARQLSDGSRDLRELVKEVAERYLKKYNEDMAALGIGEPDKAPKATEHIDDMMNIIRGLLEKGYAYESGGDVYFRVKKFRGYGKLSHQSIEMMESGARIAPGEKKEDPLDFALWKRSKEDEPSWTSGDLEGRPGWHIECSAMSSSHLGTTFDIHGGGLDLIFPHHENEIAQSEAYSGKRFANYWMHNGLLTINGQKMAKSLGNYLSIPDFLGKYRDPDILKLFFLSMHYRSPVDFTEENIQAAKAAKERFSIFFERAEEYVEKPAKGVRLSKKHRAILETMEEDFEKAMDDDFNTALALAALFAAVTEGNSFIDSDKANADEKVVFLSTLVAGLKELGGVLGLGFSKQAVADDFQNMVKQKIDERNDARKNKDYKRADQIREELDKKGVTLEDTATGTKWRLK